MSTPRQYQYHHCTYCRAAFDPPRRHHTCSKCGTAIRNMKREAVKQGHYAKGCADCGETDRRVLEIHHDTPRDGKEASAGTRGRTPRQLAHHLESCTILCANCHKKRHYTAPKDATFLHTSQHGRKPGYEHYSTKATPEMVEYVKAERAKGRTLKDIGQEMGVAGNTILRWSTRDWSKPL